jgi:hypothetical protein
MRAWGVRGKPSNEYRGWVHLGLRVVPSTRRAPSLYADGLPFQELFLAGLCPTVAMLAQTVGNPGVVEGFFLSDEGWPSFLQALRARNLHLAS